MLGNLKPYAIPSGLWWANSISQALPIRIKPITIALVIHPVDLLWVLSCAWDRHRFTLLFRCWAIDVGLCFSPPCDIMPLN